ncbi:hypothetical protein CUJ91_18380 [Paraburkholderia graminis]|uniref:hypothetical protein n=1 Tax=Paraburkholderia graminis TaxID=60548 RepID=UPI000DF01EF5|nr:hypothetical protein [Paraburkholderia graminis]AXF09989.1 hypothetical protein CUJ91_18380 [Paraburkholderia graminis]
MIREDATDKFMRIRATISAAALLLGVGLAIKPLVAAEYVGAAATLLCGILVGAAVMLGFIDSLRSPWWDAGAALCTGLSIVSVFSETPGADLERQKVQLEIWHQSMNIEFGLFGQVKGSSAFNVAARSAFRTCALQGTDDMMSTTVAAEKAIQLGPTSSLVDASVQSVSTDKSPPDCLSLFKVMYRENPSPFSTIVSEHGQWLRQHGVIE